MFVTRRVFLCWDLFMFKKHHCSSTQTTSCQILCVLYSKRGTQYSLYYQCYGDKQGQGQLQNKWGDSQDSRNQGLFLLIRNLNGMPFFVIYFEPIQEHWSVIFWYLIQIVGFTQEVALSFYSPHYLLGYVDEFMQYAS